MLLAALLSPVRDGGPPIDEAYDLTAASMAAILEEMAENTVKDIRAAGTQSVKLRAALARCGVPRFRSQDDLQAPGPQAAHEGLVLGSVPERAGELSAAGSNRAG